MIINYLSHDVNMLAGTPRREYYSAMSNSCLRFSLAYVIFYLKFNRLNRWGCPKAERHSEADPWNLISVIRAEESGI